MYDKKVYSLIKLIRKDLIMINLIIIQGKDNTLKIKFILLFV